MLREWRGNPPDAAASWLRSCCKQKLHFFSLSSDLSQVCVYVGKPAIGLRWEQRCCCCSLSSASSGSACLLSTPCLRGDPVARQRRESSGAFRWLGQEGSSWHWLHHGLRGNLGAERSPLFEIAPGGNGTPAHTLALSSGTCRKGWCFPCFAQAQGTASRSLIHHIRRSSGANGSGRTCSVRGISQA